ncbi:NADPH-dependent FMN reductase [Haladaptatus paucihalophilus DX253]|uniref:NAD(P)H-dependent FMN reductase n=1 Tax=Haladaptatus paucihalophilus DX253 TaxID=797209 RepID=E7QQN1_HALPU|nr:NAD(P)H-dependent oxidoreductase [Haladaptatus paucihalophilus]EFW93295.1 NADPH-dependent FMN reductase [Haladaptatus paucihalophilus DX253]SHK50486.1 NAD(P)H-dependent FMN reductase [Haladaptatus paucihalophilus DX253]
MTNQPRVVAICGSLNEKSTTRVALQNALVGVESEGGTGELLDLREFDLPLFDPSNRDAGDAAELKRRVREADAVILGTPVYHGSYSSPLKTALDYCGFDEFEGKTVGLLAVAGGRFPITAMDHLRSVCRALDAWVLPYEAAIPRSHSAVVNGAFTDAELESRVVALGRQIVLYANIEPCPESFESGENIGAVD